MTAPRLMPSSFLEAAFLKITATELVRLEFERSSSSSPCLRLTNLLPDIKLTGSLLSQHELRNSDPTKQFHLQWNCCEYVVVDGQSIEIEHGDCTDCGVELTAHLPSRPRFSVEQAWFLPHVDRRETEDIRVEPIHSRLDSVRFCMVPQQER